MILIFIIAAVPLMYWLAIRRTPEVALDADGKLMFKKHIQPIEACLGILPFLMMILNITLKKYSSLPRALVYEYSSYIPFFIVLLGFLLSWKILRGLKRYAFEKRFTVKYMRSLWLVLGTLTIILTLMTVLWDGE